MSMDKHLYLILSIYIYANHHASWKKATKDVRCSINLSDDS